MNKYILLASSLLISSLLNIYAQSVVTNTATTPTNNQASSSLPLQAPSTTSGSTSTNQAILLAQIDLYDATIKKAGLVNYVFSFTLKSFDLIDQEAYYRAILKDKNNKVVFLQSFPTKVVVGAGESKLVSDTLIVPQDFKGTFSVSIQVTNAKGLPLATANAGEITLTGSASIMSIKNCTISGDSSKTSSDTITGVCDITGKTTKNTSLYTTVYYGGMAVPSVQVKAKVAGDKATFSIPPRTDAGSYQVVSQLYDAGTPMSSPIFNRFVVEGQTAKIISIKTDKGLYKKEEIANVTVALQTYNVRSGDLLVAVKLEDEDKDICGSLPATILKNGNTFTLEVPITQKCSLPSVTVTITDKTGKVLDTYTTVVVATGEKQPTPLFNPSYVGIGAGLIILLVLGFFITRRLRNKVSITV